MPTQKTILCLSLLVALPSSLHCSHAIADDGRLIVENGITYREVHGIEKRPVADRHMEERTETVYRTEYVTEVREQTRTVWIPVTNYVYEPRWNPFVQPNVTYQMRPVTRWEPRTETVQVPVTVQKVMPETRIVQTPVRSLGFAEREYVQRIAVGPAPRAPATIARQPMPVTTPTPVRR